MADGYDYTTDPEFLNASPSDQMHYLATVDPDFAKASPQDQLGYVAHIRGVGPVQGPQQPVKPDFESPVPLGNPRGPLGIPSMMAQPVAELGANLAYDPKFAKETATYGAGSAIAIGTGVAGVSGALDPAISAVQGMARAHPIASRIAASAAISQARKIPVVGKEIPPWAEMAPWIMGAPGEERTPTGRPEGAPNAPVDMPTPVGKVPNAGPRPNGPYSGPNVPSMEPAQSGNIAKYGYVPETRTMVTEFKNGKVYEHTGVPKEIYDNFRNAESLGSYHAQNIRGRYTTNYRGSVSPTTSK